MTEPIVLWGLSGSGKSTTASELAAMLHRRYVNTDTVIEETTGRRIPEIFALDGESRFRELECDAVARAMSQSGAVIAIGGGAILHPANRVALAKGRTVWLRASLSTLTTRLSSTADRPLLAGDLVARLRALADQRSPWYGRAEAAIDTDGRSARDVAAEIAGLLTPEREREPRTMHVQAASGAYSVVSGQGVIDSLPETLCSLNLSRRLWLIGDSTVLPLFGVEVAESLMSKGFSVRSMAIPSGEHAKNLSSVAQVWDWLADQGAERTEALVALGGGVVGDLVGFAASTYLRGVPLVQIPTSLLAQVDSSIGGKTAIDHPRAKNMIGAFYPARHVLVDVAFLHGLPPSHVSAGWAEVLKHGVILDAELFDYMVDNGDRLLHLSPLPTLHAIRRSLAIKARVVEQDERESRWRMVLNFGHTIGHALEAATGYSRYLHGQAVALGMLGAGWIAVERNLLAHTEFDRLRKAIVGLGLPAEAPEIDVGAVIETTLRDKKVRGRRVQWVLPTKIGAVTITDDVPDGEVEEAVRFLRDGAFRI